MGRSLEIDDPLTAAIAPPPNETPAEKAERERREEEERKVEEGTKLEFAFDYPIQN